MKEVNELFYGDENEQLEEDKRHAKLGRDRRKNGLNRLLQDKETREFLWHVLSQCGIYSSVSSFDPVSMGYRSGLRDIGLLILNEILTADPLAYAAMMAENGEGDLSDY